MSSWETEDESTPTIQSSLPPPPDTPHRRPSRPSSQHSHRSSRRKSPALSSSPAELPEGALQWHQNGGNHANLHNISVLDPRRFTPTLHANLVAEILSLRRDQEEKGRLIEALEADLFAKHNETDELVKTLAASNKDARSLQRQLSSLESGTSLELQELARERDEVVKVHVEMKARLESTNKRLREQEDAIEQSEQIWARDRDDWKQEKYKSEHKVRVAEDRLQHVLAEVAAYQELHHDVLGQDVVGYVHDDDNASIRSVTTLNDRRTSLFKGRDRRSIIGRPLNEELNLESDDDDLESLVASPGRESVVSGTHARNQSSEGACVRRHNRRESTDSIAIDSRKSTSFALGHLVAQRTVLQSFGGGIAEVVETPVREKPVYIDAAMQYSPPPSPVLKALHVREPSASSKPVPASVEKNVRALVGRWETGANQARKRIPTTTTPSVIEQASPTLLTSHPCPAPSREPPSPPLTPRAPLYEPPSLPKSEVAEHEPGSSTMALARPEMIAISTQTDEITPPPPPTRDAPTPPSTANAVLIPAIAVHPPNTRPSTPELSFLQPYTRDSACQASLPLSIETSSIGVQTEQILVDTRVNLLPRHLQPSFICSTTDVQQRGGSLGAQTTIPTTDEPPPRNPRRMKSALDSVSSAQDQISKDSQALKSEELDNKNDRKPASRGRYKIADILSVGVDTASSDDGEECPSDVETSNAEFRTALTAPRGRKDGIVRSRRVSATPESEHELGTTHLKHALEKKQAMHTPAPEIMMSTTTGPNIIRSTSVLDEPFSPAPSPVLGTFAAKQGTMRRAALIQNGISAHQNRAQALGLETGQKDDPPFPIPKRASSRRPSELRSIPGSDTGSPTKRFRGSQAQRYGPRHGRTSSIRRTARPAPHVSGNQPRHLRAGSRSSQASLSPAASFRNRGHSPLPRNSVTTSRKSQKERPFMQPSHKHQPSQATIVTNTTAPAPVVGSSEGMGVVDAIAQTMVGEWMYKYVRRRKSFGITESPHDAANGARHRRWVWLAPYERAVMWSNKQPASGAALMGKSGRKLTIQSVLDVKDDNPPPKGSPPIFDRSILILTPARALKFTAINKERHYAWLTALIFLAHSNQAVPENISSPVYPNHDTQPDYVAARKTKPPKSSFRESLRMTKRVPGTTKSAPHSAYSEAATDIVSRPSDVTVSESANAQFWRGSLPLQAAIAPIVPRHSERDNFRTHTRKRSTTAPHNPLSLRMQTYVERPPPSLPHSATASSFTTGGGISRGYDRQPSITGYSESTTTSTAQSQTGWTRAPNRGRGPSRSHIRSSEASTRPSFVANNFFESIGTMRMEAFISPLASTGTNTLDDRTHTFLDEASDPENTASSRADQRISRDTMARPGRGFAAGRRWSRERRLAAELNVQSMKRRSRIRTEDVPRLSEEVAAHGRASSRTAGADPFSGF